LKAVLFRFKSNKSRLDFLKNHFEKTSLLIFDDGTSQVDFFQRNSKMCLVGPVTAILKGKIHLGPATTILSGNKIRMGKIHLGGEKVSDSFSD